MWFHPLYPWNVLQSAPNIHYKVTISDHTKKEHYQLQTLFFLKKYVGRIHEDHVLLKNANTDYSYKLHVVDHMFLQNPMKFRFSKKHSIRNFVVEIPSGVYTLGY